MSKSFQAFSANLVHKLAYSQQWSYQFFRFALNGVGTAIIYVTIATILLYADNSFYVASFIAYTIAIIYHYYLSKHIVFRSKSISRRQLAIYIFNCIIGLGSAAAARAIVHYFERPEYFAFVLNALALPFISFIILKFLVFNNIDRKV